MKHLHPELQLFDLISPSPIKIEGIGLVRKRKAFEIGDLQYPNYTMYLNMLMVSVDDLIKAVHMEDYFSVLTNEQKSELTLFDLILMIPDMKNLYLQILNYFVVGDVIIDDIQKAFIVLTEEEVIQDTYMIKQKKPSGIINRENYLYLFQVILQTNYIKTSDSDDGEVKSKKALAIFEKIKKERKKTVSKSQNSMDTDFGNIISKLCTYNSGLNIINVWDMTVYQIYNQFYEQNKKQLIDIKSMNYSTWGGDFDLSEWIQSIR